MGDDGSDEMNTSAMSEKVVAGLAVNSGSAFYSSGWDPIVSLSQSGDFRTSSMAAHGVFVNPLYPDPCVAEMVQKLPVFGGGNYAEMANPFGMPASMASVPSQEYCQMPERTLTASPNGKRKWASNPSSASSPNEMDLSGETSEPRESDEKKQKTEYNSDHDQFTKQTGKQVKDGSQSGDGSKGNYIHVRARRGQATNSHSLAERVRREKISERMRMLQELVPGCNKITGKAVMLDEIINYVQSLQQQVEFLSMKLATVNPELNFDIDRILSKDILQLRGGVAPLLGLSPGTSSHPYAPGIHLEALPGISNAPTYHPLPQGMWDGEMQGLFHMGFDSNQAIANLGPNGGSKPEA